MAVSLDLVQLGALIARARMNDRELGKFLGIAQSSAWRLRNGKISKVKSYIQRLREHLGDTDFELADEDFRLISDLVALSGQIPALRRTLQGLCEIMHKIA